MRMTLRQIRAYIGEAVALQAREYISGSVVAGLHGLMPESRQSILVDWQRQAGIDVGGQKPEGPKVLPGGWKVIPADQTAAFFGARGKVG